MAGWREIHVEGKGTQTCNCKQAFVLKIHVPKEPGDGGSTKSKGVM